MNKKSGKVNLRKSGGLMAATLGALLIAPATAKCSILISISTAAPTAIVGTATTSFTFSGISSTSVVLGTSLAIGSFTLDAGGTANGNVVDIKMTPNVNGSTAVLDFYGTVNSLGPAYYLDFSATPGATSATVGGTAYTEQLFRGYEFGIATQDQLPGGSPGKLNSISGIVTTTPEPASAATTGLALALAAWLIRKRMKPVQSN